MSPCCLMSEDEEEKEEEEHSKCNDDIEQSLKLRSKVALMSKV